MTRPHDIVITGLGVVSPIGVGLDAVWASLSSGKSGVQVRPGFEAVSEPWAMAAPVTEFDGKRHVQPRKSLKVMCREIQMGYAAASMALADAGLAPGAAGLAPAPVGEAGERRELEAATPLLPERTGTVFGGEAFYANPEDLVSVFRHVVALGNDVAAWGEVALREIEPLWMLKYLPNMVASHLSILMDARGPSNSIVLGDNSSLPAIIEGVEWLRRGWVDRVVAGGTGSQMSPTATVYRDRTRLAPKMPDPTQVVRPFDKHHQGTVFGEGAAAVVLETRQAAQARGAQIWATIRGVDRAFAPTWQHLPNRLAHAIEATLRQGAADRNEPWQPERLPQRLGHLNANGTGVPMEDLAEAQGIRQACGGAIASCPVFAPKSYFGNLGPGTGAVELACSLLAMRYCTLPATLNFAEAPADAPLEVHAEPRPLHGEWALVMNQNPTGQIATLLLESEPASADA
jgi:3-oxoacyl-[acyl-carrier-protein] synthase II